MQQISVIHRGKCPQETTRYTKYKSASLACKKSAVEKQVNTHAIEIEVFQLLVLRMCNPNHICMDKYASYRFLSVSNLIYNIHSRYNDNSLKTKKLYPIRKKY